MTKVVFLDYDSTSRNDLDLSQLEASCTSLTTWPQTKQADLISHIADAEIIISNKVIIDAELLEKLQHQIKLICVAATGTNNIDLDAAKHFKIPVTNVRNYASQSVAEHSIGLLFTLSRQIAAYQQAVARGDWARSHNFCLLDCPITEIAGKTLAIIGYGNLGQATTRLAKAVGMNVMIAERAGTDEIREGRVSLDTLFNEADIISLHCPLDETTRDLVDAKRLQQMKPSAFLINTARGGIVNEADLLEALKRGDIAGAAIDTLEQEPPTKDSILLSEQLPNLIISPHVAWASQNARQTLLNQLADIISGWQRGELINRVV
uniref:D-3-phosphoglycerate dehydrogenase (EC) n=1 Tax=uncultured Thiotrichaceae bacterium TaxID=298394 RepID=A0A6S6UFP6_9GAMM|nr:MAG: D-3-phosphoglycerate dehydrogenase (EC [uncultured Thiotrichaceae bacterium]